MGNRAVITTKGDLSEVGIYLHWNGGVESVESFLAYCEIKGYRSTLCDTSYALVCLAKVITNFFSDGLSCGIGIAEKLNCDNWDNGTYIISGWNICARMYTPFESKILGKFDKNELRSALLLIDSHQPESQRITEEEWKRFDEVSAGVKKARKKIIYL